MMSEQNKNRTQYALVTTLHKQTQLTSTRDEPSYKQLEVKINIVLNNDKQSCLIILSKQNCLLQHSFYILNINIVHLFKH
jgi:hypothetical protein